MNRIVKLGIGGAHQYRVEDGGRCRGPRTGRVDASPSKTRHFHLRIDAVGSLENESMPSDSALSLTIKLKLGAVYVYTKSKEEGLSIQGFCNGLRASTTNTSNNGWHRLQPC